MAYVKNTTFHNLLNGKKHHVYEDESNTRRNVVTVRGILNFMIRKMFAKFC